MGLIVGRAPTDFNGATLGKTPADTNMAIVFFLDADRLRNQLHYNDHISFPFLLFTYG